MNGYVSLAYRLLGKHGEGGAADGALQTELLKADWPIRASAFRASAHATAILGSLGGLLAGGLLVSALPAPLLLKLLVPLTFALFLGGMVVALAPLLLRNAALEREKDIDENLPHALNYMLALANAGMPPREVWGSLARAKVFGALAVEAERIRRDLDLFGYNLLDAMRAAQERTPSRRFAEFLQGAISAFQSGVELENYLRNKGDQFQRQAVEAQIQDIETMGLMAETFLVVVVAAPLFMTILLTVMAVNQGARVLTYGYLMTLLFVPLMQVIIGALVRSMNPRVWT